MTSKGLGEMFEGDSAVMCTQGFPYRFSDGGPMGDKGMVGGPPAETPAASRDAAGPQSDSRANLGPVFPLC
jgi:hypothetical protein